MKKPIDILIKYQPYLIGLAIFLSLTSISFISSGKQFKFIFHNYPSVMIGLVLASILIALIYIMIDKNRIKNLSKEIKETTTEKHDQFVSLLSELTSRQKEVYEMILSGKSNKEIMAELFIEQSTLKSHINQLYKKLNIKSRKELKSKSTVKK